MQISKKHDIDCEYEVITFLQISWRQNKNLKKQLNHLLRFHLSFISQSFFLFQFQSHKLNEYIAKDYFHRPGPKV